MSQSPLNFAAELLAESWDANGDRWTVLDRAAGRRAHVVKKNTTTVHYTISYGGQGVSIEAVDDLTERANVIFGSGIRPDGGAWSNYFYPEGHPETPPPFPLGAGHYTPGGPDSGFILFADEMRRSGYPDFDSHDTYRNDDGDIDDVEDFQRRSGLAVTGDVNAATWNALFASARTSRTLRYSYHLPLAWDPRVEPYLYNGQGARIGEQPGLRPDGAAGGEVGRLRRRRDEARRPPLRAPRAARHRRPGVGDADHVCGPTRRSATATR
jgi:hypothetical protein